MPKAMTVESVRTLMALDLSNSTAPGTLLFKEALRGRLDVQQRLEQMGSSVDPSRLRLEIKLSYDVSDHLQEREERVE